MRGVINLPEIKYKRILLKVSGEALAGEKGSSLGTGGMKTKLHAADICMKAGCDMIIANGEDPDVLYAIMEGKEIGESSATSLLDDVWEEK